MYVHVSTKDTTYGPGMIPTMPGFTYSQTLLVSTPGDPPNCYSLSAVLANHIIYIMGYKLGYHILVLPDQVLLINSVLTNKVQLYVRPYPYTYLHVSTYSGAYIRMCVYVLSNLNRL